MNYSFNELILFSGMANFSGEGGEGMLICCLSFFYIDRALRGGGGVGNGEGALA